MQDYNKKQSQQYEKKPKFDASKLNKSNYVEWAEKIIKNHQQEMKKMEKSPVTTNQVRNLLELLNILRERLRIERVKKLDEDMQGQVQYIKLRFVYAAGRDNESKGVRNFIQRSGMIECFDTVGDSIEQYELVCKYMEALVAYHKYYIDKQ